MSGRNWLYLTRGVSVFNLVVLDASDNVIEEIPDWIGEMRNLRRLDLSNNQLRGLPDELSQLRRLEMLDLRGNPLPKWQVDKVRAELPEAEVLF